MYRQGDLLFIKTDRVVGNMKHGLKILESNITGHSHELTKGKVYVNDSITLQNLGNFYVEIPEGGAEVIHPEHKAIPLEEGVYEVRRQREVNGYVQD